MRKIQKVLIEQKTGKKYFVKDIDDDFHTSSGIISSKELKSKKAIVVSSKNVPFLLLEPYFADLLDSLERGPQVVLPKDVGWILAKTGVNRESKVVDAGAGSGSLCLALANVCKEVTTYEINPEHINVVTKNKALFGINNLTIRQGSIYDEIKEKDVDLVTLDVAEPWRAMKVVEGALKPGAFLVVYLPQITQVHTFVGAARNSNILVMEIVELLERHWKVEERICRPDAEMLGHTGFMVLGRKM